MRKQGKEFHHIIKRNEASTSRESSRLIRLTGFLSIFFFAGAAFAAQDPEFEPLSLRGSPQAISFKTVNDQYYSRRVPLIHGGIIRSPDELKQYLLPSPAMTEGAVTDFTQSSLIWYIQEGVSQSEVKPGGIVEYEDAVLIRVQNLYLEGENRLRKSMKIASLNLWEIPKTTKNVLFVEHPQSTASGGGEHGSGLPRLYIPEMDSSAERFWLGAQPKSVPFEPFELRLKESMSAWFHWPVTPAWADPDIGGIIRSAAGFQKIGFASAAVRKFDFENDSLIWYSVSGERAVADRIVEYENALLIKVKAYSSDPASGSFFAWKIPKTEKEILFLEERSGIATFYVPKGEIPSPKEANVNND